MRRLGTFDFLNKKAQNLEINDLDLEPELHSKKSIDYRASQIFSQLSSSSDKLKRMFSSSSDPQLEKQDPEQIAEESKIEQIVEQPSKRMAPQMTMQESIKYSSLLRNSLNIDEIRTSLHKLSLSWDLENLLASTIDQAHRIIDITATLTNKFDSDDKHMALLLKIQKTIFLCSIQLQEVAAVLALDDAASPEQVKELVDSFSSLGEFWIQISSKKEVNLPILQSTLKYLSNQILREIEDTYKNLINYNDSESQIDSFNDAKITHSKLRTAIEVLPFAVTFDKDDLFSLEQDHPEWERLRKRTVLKQLGDPKEIQESFKKIVKGILLANAMVSTGSEQDTAFQKSLFQNFGAIYYFFESQKAKKKANLFISEPRTSVAISVWNLMDQGLVKFAMSLMFPSIKYHKKIYISRVAKPITLDSIKQEYFDGSINRIDQVSQKGQVRLDMGKDEDTYYNDLFKKSDDKIRVRILCSENLYRPDISDRDSTDIAQKVVESDKTGAALKIDQIFTKVKDIFVPKKNFFDQIVIHIHGGGFVAMSSRCHQTYSRQWANSLNVPIFSIDYKKAPKHPYPEALDDVWQAYNWILNFVSRFFNIKPRKVVLVGDSAGGNLVTALTLRCIKSGVRVPDGIVIAYPALNLNLRYFTPSFLLALDDLILPHTFLKMCLDSYIPAELGLQPGADPFISPTYASDELLKELPPTRILVGTNDPLHDECWRFLRRLESLNKDVKMVLYDQMPHGFLNYDAPSGMREAKVCVQDATDFLKEILSKND